MLLFKRHGTKFQLRTVTVITKLHRTQST